MNPQDPRIHIQGGRCLEKLDQPELAFQAYSRAAQLDPQDSTAREGLDRTRPATVPPSDEDGAEENEGDTEQ
ncbi:MAG: hypothetical protein ABIH26_07725 [Candidatus Eisenbacteria bacterium]